MAGLYSTYLRPKFAAMPEVPTQLDACSAAADGISEWMRLYLGTLRCGIYGTVTTPAGMEIPYGTKVTPLMAAMPVAANTFAITGAGLAAAAYGKSGGIAVLFDYIGKRIAAGLTAWTAAPVVTGQIIAVPATGHFASQGIALLNRISQLDPGMDGLVEKIWDMFERELMSAMKASPPVTVPFMGIAPAGVFKGAVDIRLGSPSI